MLTMTEDAPQVTVCPPGKKAGLKLRAAVASPIAFVTQTALAPPPQRGVEPAPISDTLRTREQRQEAAERADARSVALAQRGGVDDAMLVEPLGVFCRRSWPPRISDSGSDLNAEHRGKMYSAGRQYAEIVHQHRVLLGLGAGGRTQPEGGQAPLTEAQLRANCELSRIKRDNADAVLSAVFSGAVSAMMRVAVDEQHPTPYQESFLRHCLWALAVSFGLVKQHVDGR